MNGKIFVAVSLFIIVAIIVAFSLRVFPRVTGDVAPVTFSHREFIDGTKVLLIISGTFSTIRMT